MKPWKQRVALAIAVATSSACALDLWAAPEVILPSNRSAFYANEAIEIAVTGAEGKAAHVEITPHAELSKGLSPLAFDVAPNATAVVLPANSLAPGTYSVTVQGGAGAVPLTISTGVNNSTMLVSQTIPTAQVKEAGGNFFVSNSFAWSQIGPDGLPLKEIRGKHSSGFMAFENAVKADMPSVVYMYWTGYVVHKPFGSHKSWAAQDVIDGTRLLNFHNAQWMRRFDENIHVVGTLDEPGLSWGATPAGGSASGFPNWDEAYWYEKHGWQYTQDIASRNDPADWIKYMTVRCGIMGEVNAIAKNDIHQVWPGMVFSTDLYAPSAIMDGTDPLNQRVNDIPASHVFMDWGVGKLGALSGLYLEKSHDPSAKLAHAMNGQLFSAIVPQPNQGDAYHLMMNAMLASGLHSNWWLNTGGMSPADLKAVNEPAVRVGPVFQEMELKNHDVAVLWSFTEAAILQQDMAKKEAAKKDGEQIKMMIASLPENSALKEGELDINAYSIGGNYKEAILNFHQALARAGYPAHIIHERVLPEGGLKPYKTLVIVGQTFDFPDDVKKALAEFTAGGGKIVVDKTTTIKLENAIVTDADIKDPAYRWTPLFLEAVKKENKFKTPKEASYFLTNYFMDDQTRKAVPALRETMKKTDSKPSFIAETSDLAAEKHAAGEGSLYMVINAYEKLPEGQADDKPYWIYNYAPFETTYSLQGIAPGSTVYCIEGINWDKVTKVTNFDQPQKASFAAGEMKLYLVAPRDVTGIDAQAAAQGNTIAVTATLQGAKMPWPLTVTLTASDGKALYKVYRATNKDGQYTEAFPIGSNVPAGAYTIDIESPAGGFKKQVKVDVKGAPVAPQAIADAVRVFDEASIKKLLAAGQPIVIAAGPNQQAAADKLAAALKGKGMNVSVKPDEQVLHKVAFPIVWNPEAILFSAGGEAKMPEGAAAAAKVTVSTDADGNVTAKSADGKEAADWHKSALVTVGGEGLVNYLDDMETAYEPGVQLYYDDKGALTVVKGERKMVKTDEAFRKKWAKPWSKLTIFVGGMQYPPGLPAAYGADTHLILLGDSTSGQAVASLQASELPAQIVDAKYPGAGRSLIQYAWSPFGVEKDVIYIGASDAAGLDAGIAKLSELIAK